jgi:hypothetical protein
MSLRQPEASDYTISKMNTYKQELWIYYTAFHPLRSEVALRI